MSLHIFFVIPLNNSVTLQIRSKDIVSKLLGCTAGVVQRGLIFQEMNHDFHDHTLLVGAKQNMRLAGRTGITWNFRAVE